MTQVKSAFEFISSTEVSSLNLTVEHYQHTKTGAVHYHLAADNQEKVFMVALRTIQKTVLVWRIFLNIPLCAVVKNIRCATPSL